MNDPPPAPPESSELKDAPAGHPLSPFSLNLNLPQAIHRRMPAPRISKTKSKALAKAQRVAVECKAKPMAVVEKVVPESVVGMTLAPMPGTPCVEIRDCEYGKGVFATRDIRVGEIITHYGGHIRNTDYTSVKQSEYSTNEELRELVKIRGEYAISSKIGAESFVIDGRYAPRDDPLLCGHLFNDPGDWFDDDVTTFVRNYKTLTEDVVYDDAGGCYVPISLWLAISSFVTNKQAYVSKQNTDVLGNTLTKMPDGTYGLPMVATRIIKAGEQIYYAYGIPYWIQTILADGGLDSRPYCEWRDRSGESWCRVCESVINPARTLVGGVEISNDDVIRNFTLWILFHDSDPLRQSLKQKLTKSKSTDEFITIMMTLFPFISKSILTRIIATLS